MTNRRQFLGLGLAAAVWPGVAPALVRRRAESAGSGIYKVICDRRAPAAAAFAAPLRARGVPMEATDGDVTRLWYDDLASRWREAPVAIAGLTAPETLFRLEQLARGHRMRVVFRAERVVGGRERALRQIDAPEPVLARIARVMAGVDGGADAASLARLALQSPQAASRPGRRARVRLPERPQDAATADPWVAWAIAPVHGDGPAA